MSAITKKAFAALITVSLLSACGDSPGHRAVTGAGIGAGVGAVGAVVLDANPVAGALVGAAAGGVTGAATTKKDINLGN